MNEDKKKPQSSKDETPPNSSSSDYDKDIETTSSENSGSEEEAELIEIDLEQMLREGQNIEQIKEFIRAQGHNRFRIRNPELLQTAPEPIRKKNNWVELSNLAEKFDDRIHVFPFKNSVSVFVDSVFVRKEGKEILFFGKKVVEEGVEIEYYFYIFCTKKRIFLKENKLILPDDIPEYLLENCFWKSAMSKDQRVIVLYITGYYILEYRIETNLMITHDTKSIELSGKKYEIVSDCMNENFEEYLVIELYCEDTTWSTLSFYKYYLRRKRFDKVFEIGDSPVGKKLRHSYSKIDRNSIHNQEDCLLVFRFCQSNADQLASCDIFYVNLTSKRLLFQKEVELQYEESYYRRAMYLPFLWNDREKIVMRFGSRTLLVLYRELRKAKLHRLPNYDSRNNDFDQFVTLLPQEDFDEKKCGELFLPKGAFKFYEFEKFCLVYSEVAMSDFKVSQFKNIDEYTVLSTICYQKIEKKYINYPFLYFK